MSTSKPRWGNRGASTILVAFVLSCNGKNSNYFKLNMAWSILNSITLPSVSSRTSNCENDSNPLKIPQMENASILYGWSSKLISSDAKNGRMIESIDLKLIYILYILHDSSIPKYGSFSQGAFKFTNSSSRLLWNSINHFNIFTSYFESKRFHLTRNNGFDLYVRSSFDRVAANFLLSGVFNVDIILR